MFPAELVTFTKEILMAKLHFFVCSVYNFKNVSIFEFFPAKKTPYKRTM